MNHKCNYIIDADSWLLLNANQRSSLSLDHYITGVDGKKILSY